MNRLLELRERLYDLIQSACKEDDHHKSYEGHITFSTVSMGLNGYFEDEEYSLVIDCYMLGDTRHTTITAKSYERCLDMFEDLLYQWEEEKYIPLSSSIYDTPNEKI